MKIYLSLSFAAATALCIVVYSCSKEVTGRTDNIAALSPANNDTNAGNWKTILLKSPDTFAVAAPAAITSAVYIGELNEVKGLQQNLTQEQKNIVKYWSAGAVFRWNEILRQLVAKHNLPPYQNEDGTYPIPSAMNPFNYPEFPFSNPPYAARAYAYVSAAQYDALVSAWHYKMMYRREAPYQIDSVINSHKLISASDLPSYPSEDAVVAGVTAEMMKMLFPTEIAFIEKKAAEAEQARLLAGANVRSDLTAGETLGRAVAQNFIARGKGDYAGKAVGAQADWDKLVTDCEARGEDAWLSLESPKRPPMLPMYGNVKAFLFDSITCVSLRPGPPPSTGSQQMKDETAEVYDMVQNPSRDHIRMVQFWADGVGTYTPAGHWDAIASEDFIKQNWSEVRWARNMALLNISLMDAGIVCWNTKYFYFNPRPSQMNQAIKTLTGIPNFPSYISGHSTFSGAAAEILSHILPQNAAAYAAMAQEASLSRLYGGIHFRSDCQTGLETGKKVGDYAVARALRDGAE